MQGQVQAEHKPILQAGCGGGAMVMELPTGSLPGRAEFQECIARSRQLRWDPDQAALWLARAVELGAPDFSDPDYCPNEQRRSQKLLEEALERLIAYHAGSRDYRQAIVYADQLILLDPLREEVHRKLMKLYMLDHQTAAALRQYLRCKTYLRLERGTEPMPETQALFRRLIITSTDFLADRVDANRNRPV